MLLDAEWLRLQASSLVHEFLQSGPSPADMARIAELLPLSKVLRAAAIARREQEAKGGGGSTASGPAPVLMHDTASSAV